MRFTLGGEEYTFQVFGYSEYRPNRELDDFLLNDQYREMGWRVEWGPEFMSEKAGHVRTFRITNRPLPLEQKHLFVATLGIKVHLVSGTAEKESVKLVEAEDEKKAGYAALRGECHCEPGVGMEWEGDKILDGSGSMEYSLKPLVRVHREDAATLRKYFAGW